MKFTAKVHNARRVYDTQLENNNFLRISVNRNGEYILYTCCGLDANGFTPLRSKELARARTLAECKRKARDMFEPKAESVKRPIYRDYSHVRMPYKD